MTGSRRFLMVSYAFPPVGGAGVQRSAKFAKYIGRFGWTPIVLTAKNPSVPVVDYDLMRDVPSGTTVLRARTLEPSYRVKKNLIPSPSAKPSRIKSWFRSVALRWLQPDSQILWNRPAFRLACSALNSDAISTIYVSGPPFSSFLLGCKLKKRFRKPLVLDFRDEWSLSSRYLENRSQKHGILSSQMRLFESALLQADAIVATTNASAEELQNCCERIGSKAIVRCIYNGFDPDDLTTLDRVIESSDAYRLVYTGTLWRLTDVAPFVEAVKKLVEAFPEDAKQLEMHFIGRRTSEQSALLDKLALMPVSLHRHDYLSHQQSMQFACKADGLLMTLADQQGAERVVPGKLFEYLSMQRPILSIAPHGEAQKILSTQATATNFQPSELDALAAWLHAAIRTKKQQVAPAAPISDLAKLDWCNRITLAGQLASLFDVLEAK